MTFPACQQQQPQQHDEQLPVSWSSCRKMETSKRHASAPPQQCHRTLLAKARQPWIFFRQRRRHGRPPTPRYRDSAARPATNAPFPGTAATSPATVNGGATADAPLSFPAPKFSAAVRVAVVEGGSFILTSRPTGRRWMVVGSCRKCQFGEVLRAVELKEGAGSTGPSEYFAIKVCMMYDVFRNPDT